MKRIVHSFLALLLLIINPVHAAMITWYNYTERDYTVTVEDAIRNPGKDAAYAGMVIGFLPTVGLSLAGEGAIRNLPNINYVTTASIRVVKCIEPAKKPLDAVPSETFHNNQVHAIKKFTFNGVDYGPGSFGIVSLVPFFGQNENVLLAYDHGLVFEIREDINGQPVLKLKQYRKPGKTSNY